MTAAAAVAAAADPIAYGWQVYRRLAGVAWPGAGKDEIGSRSLQLWNALEMHARLEGAVEEWTLARYALQAQDYAAFVIAAVREHCGDSDAEYVKNGGLR